MAENMELLEVRRKRTDARVKRLDELVDQEKSLEEALEIFRELLELRPQNDAEEEVLRVMAATVIQITFRAHRRRIRKSISTQRLNISDSDTVRHNPFIHSSKGEPEHLTALLCSNTGHAKILNEFRRLAIAMKLLIQMNFEGLLLSHDGAEPLAKKEQRDVVQVLRVLTRNKESKSRKNSFAEVGEMVPTDNKASTRTKFLAALQGNSVENSQKVDMMGVYEGTILSKQSDKNIDLKTPAPRAKARRKSVVEAARERIVGARKFEFIATRLLKFNSEKYISFIENIEELETKQQQMMWKKLVYISKDARIHKFPIDLMVSPMEMFCYDRLCKTLYLTSSRLPISDPIRQILIELQDSLVHLRKIEIRSASRHCYGFLNKSDNILTLLLFRNRTLHGKCPVRPPDSIFNTKSVDDKQGGVVGHLSGALAKAISQEATLIQAIQTNQSTQKRLEIELIEAKEDAFGAEKMLDELEEAETSCSCIKTNMMKNMIIVGTILLIFLGLMIIWFTWNQASTRMLSDSISRLSSELQEKQSDFIMNALSRPLFIGAMIELAIGVGDFSLINDTNIPGSNDMKSAQIIDSYFQHLMEVVNDNSVSAIFISTESGHFTGLSFDESKGTYSIKEVMNNNILNSYPFNVTTSQRDWNTIEETYTYDVRKQSWYNLDAPDWSRVHDFENNLQDNYHVGMNYHIPMKNGKGVIVVELKLSTLSLSMGELAFPAGSDNFVIDTWGDLVATSNYGLYDSIWKNNSFHISAVSDNIMTRAYNVLHNKYPDLSNIPESGVEIIDHNSATTITASKFLLTTTDNQQPSAMISVIVFDHSLWLSFQNSQDALSFILFAICFLIALFLCWVAYLIPEIEEDIQLNNNITSDRKRTIALSIDEVSDTIFEEDFEFEMQENMIKGRIDTYRLYCYRCIRTRQRAAVNMSILLILLIFGMMWLMWSVTVQDGIEYAKLQLVESAVTRIDASVYYDIHQMSLVQGAFLNRFHLGHFIDNDNQTLSLNSSSSLFKNNMKYFNDFYMPYLEEDNSLLYALYYGVEESDDLTGVGFCITSDGSRIGCYLLKENNGCYSKYLMENGTTDFNTLLYTDCGYSPKARPWYIQAVTAGKTIFTDIYEFPDNIGLGITIATPLYRDIHGLISISNTTGELVSVLALDILLSSISTSLSTKSLGKTGLSEFLLTVDSNQLEVVASSTLETTFQRGNQYLQLYAEELDPNLSKLSSTASFLLNMGNSNGWTGLNGINSWQEIPRQIADPLTFVARLQLDFNLEWMLILITPSEDFYGDFVDFRTLTMFLTLASGGVILLLVYKGLKKFSNIIEDTDMDKTLHSIGQKNISIQSLTELNERISDDIINSYAATWKRKISEMAHASQLPVSFADLHFHAEETALDHILDSNNDRNILDKCHVYEQRNELPRKIYQFLQYKYYYIAVQLALVIHIGIAFWEPPTQTKLSSDGTIDAVVWIEFACLFLEVSYFLLNLSITYQWGWSLTHTMTSYNNILSSPNEILIDMMKGVVLSLVIFDWISGSFWRFSFEYFLPLRPVLVVLMNRKLLKSLKTFFLTLWIARQVFILYFTIMVICAVMGLTLLQDVNKDLFTNSYATFIRSMITTFVYISTAENFTDVVYNAFDLNPLYVYYYFVVTIFGLFFLTAIAVGAFEHGFSTFEKRNLLKMFLFRRTGAVAGFMLLDVDESNSLTGEEFAGFLQAIAKRKNIEKFTDQQVMQIFTRVDTDFDGTINMLEFVRGIEEVFAFVEKSVIEKKFNNPSLLEVADFLNSATFRFGLIILLLLDLWSFTTYGIVHDIALRNFCRIFSIGVLFACVVELSFRIAIDGDRYFHPTKYIRNSVEVEFGHWLDFLAICIGFIGYLICAIFSNVIGSNWLEFFTCLPLLRLLSLNRSARHLLWCLVLIIPMFINLLILLALVYIVFAFYGMFLFADQFKILEHGGEAPLGNFDTMRNAVFVLFQLMVGESWQDVMYAAIKVSGWNAAYYFLLFTIIVSLLFTNLFVGVILSVYQIAEPLPQPTYRDLLRKRQNDIEEYQNRLRFNNAKRNDTH